MSLITLTYPALPDNTTAVGTQVIADLNDILNVANGGIDDANVLNAGITGSTKLKDGSVSAGKLAAASVIEAKMDYASANAGVKVWRCGPNYPGAGGGEIVRIEKSITLAAVTTVQTFTVDWSAADAVDGAITFSAAPTLSGLELLSTGAAIDAAAVRAESYFSTRSTTSCTVKIRYSTAPTGGAVTLMFLAAGAVA